MITVGIDLSSQPEDTAVCAVNWRKREVSFQCGCEDKQLDEQIALAQAVGIDAPFGWPQPYVAALASWTHVVWNKALREQLCLRKTDLDVRKVTRLNPLSVSSDKIALPAMRARALLHRHRVSDLSGDGRFYEVYPAASLSLWNCTHKGYKSKRREKQDACMALRKGILVSLRKLLPTLELPDDLCASDHVLDAFVAAIMARLAKLERTRTPVGAELEAARAEGWIHLPKPETSIAECIAL